MLINQTLTDRRIIDCLHDSYGITTAHLALLPLGADLNSSVYKADATDQKSYFIKLKRGSNHEISLTILELLQNAGIKQIIPPVKTKDSQSSHRIEDFTIIVYPFIAGQDGFKRSLSGEQWLTLGKALRQVHDINVPSSTQQHIRREAYSPKWRQIVRASIPILNLNLLEMKMHASY